MTEGMNDDQLLNELGRALEAGDSLPEAVVTSAKESYTWRSIDSELAELVFDSSVDELIGVRGAETTRQVTFRAPGVEIEVMVVAEHARRVVGQLVPPQQATIELRSGENVREQGSDSLGRFSFDDVEPGLFQIAVSTADGHSVVTEWTVV